MKVKILVNVRGATADVRGEEFVDVLECSVALCVRLSAPEQSLKALKTHNLTPHSV